MNTLTQSKSCCCLSNGATLKNSVCVIFLIVFLILLLHFLSPTPVSSRHPHRRATRTLAASCSRTPAPTRTAPAPTTGDARLWWLHSWDAPRASGCFCCTNTRTQTWPMRWMGPRHSWLRRRLTTRMWYFSFFFFFLFVYSSSTCGPCAFLTLQLSLHRSADNNFSSSLFFRITHPLILSL